MPARTPRSRILDRCDVLPAKNWSGKRDSNPRPSAWKADALPLSYSRSSHLATTRWWRGEDSNLRRLRRQIYSLLPLTARVPLQRRHELERGKRGARRQRAGEGTRTPNRLITNEMLYQLSYASASRGRSGSRNIERATGTVKVPVGRGRRQSVGWPGLARGPAGCRATGGSRGPAGSVTAQVNSKRQPRFNGPCGSSVTPGCLFPRSWRMTGFKLRQPPGFVDRAYLVFWLLAADSPNYR